MDDRVAESIRKRAQRNYSALLRGLSAVSQKRVAELIGVSETTLSSMKSEHLERFAALAAACGMQMVDHSRQTFVEGEVDALKTLATIGIGRVRPISDEDES